jgi:enamine deaminase RidA (YjgF/YER057c/UK114 family)
VIYSPLSHNVTVKGPCKLIFIAGQTPSGDNYEAVAKGDYKKQYERVIEGLTIQLKAAAARAPHSPYPP